MTVIWDSGHKGAGITLSGGNLVATGDGTLAKFGVSADTFNSSGKYYCEITVTLLDATYDPGRVGVGNATVAVANGHFISEDANGYCYNADGTTGHNGSWIAYTGVTWTTGDVISVLLDLDAGTLTFWKNGADQGEAYSGITGSWTPAVTTSKVGAYTANFGASAFAYSPPAGYTGWQAADPTPGDGDATLEELTAYGLRMAVGAGTMVALTAVGGYNGMGAVSFNALTAAGTGGNNSAAVSLSALTASATGSQENFGSPELEELVATGTGLQSPYTTAALRAPAPLLSASGYAGEVITFAGTAPAPTLECGTKDLRLTAPAPTLSATILAGTVITITARAAVPVLVAELVPSAIITSENTAAAPRLQAALLAGNVGTAALLCRSPTISATALTGNIATALLTAATPIMEAAGYPAYTITFAGRASVPYLAAILEPAVADTWNTWVLNTRKGALTEYDNFEFNSYAVWNGVVLAAGANGIVTLGTQDLDNATAITARVRAGKDDFGTSFMKRVPRAYFGHSADGDMIFRLITSEGGTRGYSLQWNHTDEVQQRRIPVGRGPKSVRWQWEAENVSGADFSIDRVLLYPLSLRRRVQ